MQRKVWAEVNCPMARAVDLIGEWGSLLILREAFAGVRRFDDFQERLQMSRNLLTARLKKLVDGGVLVRQPIAENAKRLEYVLTPMGEDLATAVVALRQWGDRWLFAPNPHPVDMIDVADGTVIPKLEVRSASGRLIGPSEIRLEPNRRKT
ncbi:transcriptional regulator [Duganella sp. CY15W]|uniref:winged helix-turn-helix transcriptional regulator n=1 Tax=Duganella sp. CY15W TaxID=2692172 RepID=UPI0013690D3F|nr:helix-turn-helix domain-containing protein [Duganella sp. CY15W]MYM26795.1 transcriptional regulator [Duganella sp. CY15W]